MNESEHARAARAAKRDHAASLGIDDAFISRMIDLFYSKIRADAVLGPIFAAHVADWTPHLASMNRFWRSVLFSSGEFNGNPMLKHVVIPDLDRAEFARWLDLFDNTLRDIGTPQAHALILERARNIANSLLNAVIVHRDGGSRDGQKRPSLISALIERVGAASCYRSDDPARAVVNQG